MKLFIPVTLITAVALPTELTAVDIEPAVNLIVKYDHGLVAENYRLHSELAEARDANMLADPEAEAEFLFPQSGDEKRWSVGISQGFDWPGAYKARAKAVDALSELNNALFDEQLHDARYETRCKLIRLISANKEAALLAEISATMDELLTKYRLAWEKGETTILDINKLSVEAARAKAAARSAASEVEQLAAEIFISVPVAERPKVEEFTDYPMWTLEPFEKYHAEAMRCSHSKIIAGQKKLAEAQASVTRAGRYPSFSLGYRHAFEEGTHFNGFTVGIGLPIYSRRNATAASKASLLAAENTALQLENELMASMRADYAAALSLRSQLDDMGPAVENADNMRLLRRALDGGELSLLDYLGEINFFREALIEYNAIRSNYLLRIASLARH